MINNDLSKYFDIKDGKIILKENPDKYISDDEIDILPLSYKLYAKLIKARYFNYLSSLILTDDINLKFYGFTDEEIDVIYTSLKRYLNQYFNIFNSNNSNTDDGNELYMESVYILQLPYYIYRPFKELKINTIQDLLNNLSQLEKVKGFGKAKMLMVNKALDNYLGTSLVAKEDVDSVTNLDISTTAINNLIRSGITDIKSIQENPNVLNHLSNAMKSNILEQIDLYNLNKINVKELLNADFELKGEVIVFDGEIYVENKPISSLHLNKRLEKIYLNSNVKNIYDILAYGFDDLNTIASVGKIKIKETKEALKKYLASNCFKNVEEHTYTQLTRDILEKIEDSEFNGITFTELLDTFSGKYTEDQIKLVVDESIKKNIIFLYEEDKLFYQFPTFPQYIYKMEAGKEKDILYSRLDGITLEEISTRYDVTRERIRQLQSKALRKILVKATINKVRFFKEDRFKYIFETYDIYKKDFVEVFGVKDRTYNYLSMRYKKGNKDIKEAIFDNNIHPKFRTLINKHFKRGMALIDGEYIEKTNKALTECFMSKYCRDEKHISYIYENYQKFIQENVPDFFDSVRQMNVFYNSLDVVDNCVSKTGKMFRYYKFDDYDFDDLLDTLDLLSYDGMEISAELLFNKYPNLMKTYDIKDKYELHNILKKLYILHPNKRIVFSRQPMIEIGKIDRRKYLLNLLRQYQSLRPCVFINLINEDTGVDKRLIPQQWLELINDYKHNGVYIYENFYEPFTSEEFDYLNEVLDKKFYTLDEFSKIFAKRFPNVDVSKKLDSQNMDKLGYNTASSFIVIKPYNATSYIKSKFINGIAKAQDLEELVHIKTFKATLDKLSTTFEVIRFSKDGDYISLEKLENSGIKKADLINYVNSVSDFVNDEEIFTIHSLRRNGFNSPLDNLGFDDAFYDSLLRGKDTFYCQRLRNGNVFCKAKEVSITNIISPIILENTKIEYDDLVNLLKEEYNIEISRYKLIEAVKGTKIYYDSIMETFYKDYMTYYEEV